MKHIFIDTINYKSIGKMFFNKNKNIVIIIYLTIIQLLDKFMNKLNVLQCYFILNEFVNSYTISVK